MTVAFDGDRVADAAATRCPARRRAERRRRGRSRCAWLLFRGDCYQATVGPRSVVRWQRTMREAAGPVRCGLHAAGIGSAMAVNVPDPASGGVAPPCPDPVGRAQRVLDETEMCEARQPVLMHPSPAEQARPVCLPSHHRYSLCSIHSLLPPSPVPPLAPLFGLSPHFPFCVSLTPPVSPARPLARHVPAPWLFFFYDYGRHRATARSSARSLWWLGSP